VSRIPARLFVAAVIRAAEAKGGFATLLARGDERGGMLLIQCSDRGVPGPLLERQFDGQWHAVGPSAKDGAAAQQDYVQRRRRVDPDLWLIELDIPDAPQFVAALDPAP
jgi:hypothetical protein